MSLSTLDCWRLLIQSRLLTKDHCQQLSTQYTKQAGAGDTKQAKPLVKWLISKNVISRYQGSLLLQGQAGPFFYGSYKIYDRIEQGRLAGTFRAVHAATNHPVVLQFVSGELAQDTARWQQLAETLPRYDHPHLARYYEAVEVGGYRFFVLEDLRGATAEEMLIDKGKMAPADACRLVRRVALALEYLHQQGRPHGDVRPANLWLESGGFVKLLLDPTTNLQPVDVKSIAPEALADRADYLAPEIAVAQAAPNAQTDIYGLGCTLFELCLGKPPFAGGTVPEKLKRHASEAIKPLPKPLGPIIAYMMAKKPEVRFQSAQQVIEKIKPLADQAKTPIEPSSISQTESAYLKALKQQAAAPAPAATPAADAPQAPVVKPTGKKSASANPVKVVTPAVKGAKGKASRSAVAERIAKARARKRRNTIMVAAGLLLALAAVGGVLYSLNVGGIAGEPVVGPPPPEVVPTDAPQPGTEPAVAASDTSDQPAADDGQSLWATPTAGEPIALDYLPGGAQVFLIARLAELTAAEEGQRVLQALGPDFEASYQAWQTAAGVEPSQVEQLVLGMYGNNGLFPRMAIVVHLKEEVSEGELLSSWGNPSAQEAGGYSYYSGASWSYLIPPDAEGKAFVMGQEPEIKDLAESELAPPLLRREIGKLLRVSDRQSHATLLFAPAFLYGDGRAIFAGDRQKALRPIQSFLGDGLKAAMASFYIGDDLFFVEMKMESDIVIDRHTLASNMRDRLARMPDQIESYIASLNPHPYWRLVAFRYPSMVRYLHGQTRVGVEEEHAVINAALPANAAHNLIFGGEMVLASTPGAAVVTAPSTAKAPPNIEALLDSKISISFDQDSLEFAMQNIVNEVQQTFKELPFEFKIRILGDDLKLDGITRNQQIRDFKQENKTVAEILTAMVRKANPVTTVKSPDEADQKLLWVVAPDPDNPSNPIVLVTTRQVATGKYTLPEIFRVK